MYMWGAHLYSLSEVIGHKLSEVAPLLLAEVKEYAVTIAIHNCTCHCCYLGHSYRGAPGTSTNTTKHSHRLNCYWLGWKTMRYLYVARQRHAVVSFLHSLDLPPHAPPSCGIYIVRRRERERGASLFGLHGSRYVQYNNYYIICKEWRTEGEQTTSRHTCTTRQLALFNYS